MRPDAHESAEPTQFYGFGLRIDGEVSSAKVGFLTGSSGTFTGAADHSIVQLFIALRSSATPLGVNEVPSNTKE
jgi:hypothetical protein